MKNMSLYSPENCMAHLCLLQAELAAFDGREKVAHGKYVLATSVAAEFGDLQLRAVACE